MSDKHGEIILCSRTAELPASWLPEAGAVPLEEARLLAILNRLAPQWRPRVEVEDDPRFKQWIPYVLLRNPRGELAAYPRQGTEARLHGWWSLGIGGHINPQDAETGGAANSPRWRDWLWNGLRRELTEEFPAAVAGSTRFLGLIHESRTAVGLVHLGAVFLHEPEHWNAVPGAELTGLRWLAVGELGHGPWPHARFELWSNLARQLLPSPSRP
jgi:predicted NUDIX family phosphoesterase